MKKNYLYAVLAMAVLSAGCGEKAAGVSVSSENAVTSGQETLFERIKMMVVGHSSKATIQVPMLPLLAQATQKMAVPHGDFISNFCIGLTFGTVKQVESLSQESINKHAAEILSQFKDETDDASKDQDKDQKRVEEFRTFFFSGSPGDAYDNCAFAIITDVSFSPVTAWDINPRDENLAPKALPVIAAAQIVAAEQLAPVANELSQTALRDPDELAKRASDVMAKKKIPWMLLLTKKTKELTGQNISIPSNGGDPVGFSIGNFYVERGHQGGKLSFAGTTWLGENNILGKTYMASLENTTSSSMTRTDTLKDSAGASASRNTEGNAGVGK